MTQIGGLRWSKGTIHEPSLGKGEAYADRIGRLAYHDRGMAHADQSLATVRPIPKGAYGCIGAPLRATHNRRGATGSIPVIRASMRLSREAMPGARGLATQVA